MPMSGYSEGSWGLSVLPQVSGIFTGTTTSPGSTSRQRPDRYTIRAGRNLPDKEFRYLRTVIVTADIQSHPMRHLGIWQSAVFLLNSRLGLFAAAPPASVALDGGAPLLPKLRGGFAEFLDVVSPAHLGLLDPSTCVGLRYGPDACNPGPFSRRAPRAPSRRVAPALRPAARQSSKARASGPARSCERRPGAGMFASSPSATPRGLALGAD